MGAKSRLGRGSGLSVGLLETALVAHDGLMLEYTGHTEHGGFAAQGEREDLAGRCLRGTAHQLLVVGQQCGCCQRLPWEG